MTEQAPPEPEQPAAPPTPAAPPPIAPPPAPATWPEREHRGMSGTAVLGLLLIAVGAIFFIGQWANLDWGAATWPFL